MIFGTENKEREIYVIRIRERIYPTRVGWGWGREYVKTKNKEMNRTVAVNDGELYAFFAETSYITEMISTRDG